MEVGHQGVGGADRSAARADEDVGLARERGEAAVRRQAGFQQAKAGGADADDPPARRARVLKGGGGLGGNFAVFGVHAVVLHRLGLHRQERAGAHVQGDERLADAAGGEPRQQLGGEVQAGGGRRHRAVVGGVDGLVVAPVTRVLRPAGGDIGRQRHHPAHRDRGVQLGPGEIKAELHLPALVLGQQTCGQVVVGAEGHPVADRQPLARAHEGAPAVRRQAAVQGGLHRHGRILAGTHA